MEEEVADRAQEAAREFSDVQEKQTAYAAGWEAGYQAAIQDVQAVLATDQEAYYDRLGRAVSEARAWVRDPDTQDEHGS